MPQPPAAIPHDVFAMLCRSAVAKGILRGRRDALLSRFEELGRDLFPDGNDFFGAIFTSGGDSADVDARAIGDTFWRQAFSDTEKRRLTGSYYTPTPIIDRILDLTWDALLPRGRIVAGVSAALCDPAMGCGYFLLQTVERLRRAFPDSPAVVRKWVRNCLFGVDRDPVAVYLARCLLWLALSEKGREFIPDPAHFVCGDALLGPGFEGGGECPPGSVDWRRAFPRVAAAGGFAVIIGNPPYEVLTNFGRHPERKELAERLRSSGHYRDALTGQINLYRCFVERSLALLRPGGTLSMIVPLSLARDAAAMPLRRRLLERENARQWRLYGEKANVFPGVTQAACVFKAVRGAGTAETLAVAAGGAESELTAVELAEAGDGLVIPSLSRPGMLLWKWLYRHCRGRLSDIAAMRVGEVDQTVFRDCMRDDDTGCLLARGSHLTPFRLDVEPRTGKERFLDLPRFLEKKGGAAEACRRRAAVWRVAQLGIRNLHSRPRLVAALAPPGVYLGNSLNVYSPLEGISPEYLAGLLNSRLLDWLFRVGSGNNNVNLQEMRQLPLPEVADAGDVRRVAGAYRLCVRVAEDAPALARARLGLDEAVERCYRLTGEMERALAVEMARE